MHARFMVFLFLSFMMVSLALFPARADESRKYIDRDYGFSLTYPADWKTEVTDVQGVRQVFARPITLRDKTSFAGCMISVGKMAQKRDYTQSELNQFIMRNPKKAEDWKRFFSPTKPESLEILETQFAAVFGNPAHYALLDDTTSQDGISLKIRKHQYLTNTPYLSWNIACMASSFDKAKTVAIFEGETKTFQQVIASLQLLSSSKP